MNSIKHLYRTVSPHWKDVPAKIPARQRKRVNSIAFATGGMLTQGNIDALYYALRETKAVDGSLLEIGSYCGLSSNVITFLKRHLEIAKPLFAIDPWDLVELDQETLARVNEDLGLSRDQLAVFIRESYKTRVGFFSQADLPHAVQGFSNDVLAKWAKGETVTDQFGRDVALGGSIAFAFIDGDHSYQGAKDDFENVDRFLSVGGIILFDDSADSDNRGCEKAAREASRHPNYELVSKNPNYMIRKLR